MEGGGACEGSSAASDSGALVAISGSDMMMAYVLLGIRLVCCSQVACGEINFGWFNFAVPPMTDLW